MLQKKVKDSEELKLVLEEMPFQGTMNPKKWCLKKKADGHV